MPHKEQASTGRKTSHNTRGEDSLTLRKQEVDLYLDATRDGRDVAERSRDYLNNFQWTDAEAAKLRKRGQAPIVVNRMRPKHEGLLGLWDLRRTDPKAYPRTRKHEKSAHAITDGLRYVSDNNDFNNTVRLDVADEFFCEGTGAAIVEVKKLKNGEFDITIKHIPWDRFYYDPFSRKLDFSDAAFMGIMLWMSWDQFTLMFPDADLQEIVALGEQGEDETFQDRPKWIDKKKRRVRVAMHYFLEKGNWMRTFFTDGQFLREVEISPYLNDDGIPTNPIEAVSAFITRDNDRFGEARFYIDIQDEINHRRSKGLYLLSRRQTFGTKGTVKDIAKLKREAAKADGHLEFPGGTKFGVDFGFNDTSDMAVGQFSLLEEAKRELDARGVNAQLAGERQGGDLSGKAIGLLQQGATIELSRQYTLLTSWEKRIYRQVWGRIKQFWDAEKWVRITDDQDNLRWVGLNAKITAREWLEDQINDKSLPPETRRQAAATFQFLMNAAQGPDPQLIELAQQGDPRAIEQVRAAQEVMPVARAKLEEFVAIKNAVAEIDADIIIDQSRDSINIQQQQFELIANIAQTSPEVDILDIIELSDIRNKEEFIEKIENRRAQRAQAQGNVAQVEVTERQAKTAETLSKTKMNEQKAIQTNLENVLLVNDPDKITSVSV